MQLSNVLIEIGNLEILAKQAVEGFIIGLHKSPFHGFSVEFAEHRLYNPGDSLKHIDWKVYGKSDKMFVKKFEEETNLKCFLALDISKSMEMANGNLSKKQFGALATVAIMQLLRKQLDAFSLNLFTDTIEWGSAIKSSERHYKSLVTELENLLHQPKINTTTTATTDLPKVLHEIAEVAPQRSLVVVFSDCLDDLSREQDLYEALQHLKFKKQEVVIFHIGDAQKEWNFDFENRPYEFIDLETRQKIKLKPQEVKNQYLEQLQAYFYRLENVCLQYNIDLIKCDINSNLNEILRAYLLKRNKLM